MRAYHFHDVGIFHHKFGLPEVTSSQPGPREIDFDLLQFRMKFLCEELQEFLEGFGFYLKKPLWEVVKTNTHDEVREPDHAQMFDALIDLVYVAYGTAHLLGYPWEEGWNAVQHANMQKVRAAKDGSNSKRGSSFDVVKPPGWQPPDIEGILQKHGWGISDEQLGDGARRMGAGY